MSKYKIIQCRGYWFICAHVPEYSICINTTTGVTSTIMKDDHLYIKEDILGYPTEVAAKVQLFKRKLNNV